VTTSRVPVLLDYLVGLFQNAPTLGTASPPVAVYDGPPTTRAPAQLVLYVGLTDPDSEDAEEAAVWTQTRIGLAAGRREDTTIRCAAEAWSGDDTISAVRHSASAIVAAVETLVRANGDQFGGNATFVPADAASYTLTQNNTSTGAICRITFDLQFLSFT
jgi:hypothetical protein